MSERTFRRWRDRLRDEGPEGLRDRRIGKPSSRRAAAEEILRMLGLYEERYSGFTVKHFHEQLHKRHHYKLGYTVTRLALQGAGLVRPAPRRSAHRKKRAAAADGGDDAASEPAPAKAGVGRALAQLGIRHIAAYSPEARGRSERAFRTLQDRLPKELALAGITTIAAANRWLAETYWPAHNAAFAVAPAEIGSAFVADRTGRVRDILCIQEERRVGNDNTVKWRRLTLQIPPNPLRPHFVRAVVRVHEYPDGRLAVFHGPHRLAEYDAQGRPHDDAKLAA